MDIITLHGFLTTELTIPFGSQQTVTADTKQRNNGRAQTKDIRSLHKQAIFSKMGSVL